MCSNFIDVCLLFQCSPYGDLRSVPPPPRSKENMKDGAMAGPREGGNFRRYPPRVRPKSHRLKSATKHNKRQAGRQFWKLRNTQAFAQVGPGDVRKFTRYLHKGRPASTCAQLASDWRSIASTFVQDLLNPKKTRKDIKRYPTQVGESQTQTRYFPYVSLRVFSDLFYPNKQLKCALGKLIK